MAVPPLNGVSVGYPAEGYEGFARYLEGYPENAGAADAHADYDGTCVSAVHEDDAGLVCFSAISSAECAPDLQRSPLLVGSAAVALMHVQQAGVELDEMALAALSSLPPDDAAEMLDYVADNHPHLRNASKYISSTISRGFVPRRATVSGAPLSTASNGAIVLGSPGVAVVQGRVPLPPAAVPRSKFEIGPVRLTNPPKIELGARVRADGVVVPASEDMDKLMFRAQEAGLMFSDEALSALASLPNEHASELLCFVLEKHTELRDPSNYIASTVARGFKSRRPSSVTSPFVVEQITDDALAACFQRLSEVGVELDDMARQALSSLPSEHAMEMLEYVMENHQSLRAPSNYISSTVARGFVSRRTGARVLSVAPTSFTPSSVLDGKGSGKAAGKAGIPGSLLPSDATPLEKRVLHLNSTALKEPIDFVTYLALRSVPHWQSTELLDSLESKSAIIASPCNYVQAAVTKIQRSGRQFGVPPEVTIRRPTAIAPLAVTSVEAQLWKKPRLS